MSFGRVRTLAISDLKAYKDAVYELVELCEDVIIQFEGHAGSYLAEKYHYGRDMEELKQRLAESEGE